MAENTKIEWCDHTFNPWTGCTKVSPGCANCYAEGWAKRSGIVTWGKGQPRRRTSEANWKQPLKWNRQAEGGIEHDNATWDGEIIFRRPRVFCASLADWLDDEVPIEWLADLLHLIRITPQLDWLLLTKRPENFQARLFSAWHDAKGYSAHTYDWIKSWERGAPYENNHVWIGTTVEDQQRADERIPALLSIPAKVRFLSCEPLLGPVDVRFGFDHLIHPDRPTINWVICGGESGPHARPMIHGWAACLRDQCQVANVPFLFKQCGEWAPTEPIQSPLADMLAPGMQRLGKKAAGRQLDGREWNEFPIL